MLNKVDHIGIAVRSLEETIPYYEKALGLSPSPVEEVASQNVRVVFFEVGQTHIELLEPTSPESPIAKFIEKNGPGIHHIALGTDNIEAQLRQASENGCKLIHEKPFEGGNEKLVAFLHPKSTFGVLTEFCQHAHGACGHGEGDKPSHG
jgi:methylmalonyl-CoA/ethylmalonyl-CoA epimerase